MTQTVQLKRSATSGSIPSTSDLALGELAINTYDGKAYIKKSVGGTESIVEVGADTSSDMTSMVHYVFNASANQTTFSGNDVNGESLGYTAGSIAVFLNGVFLDPDDYTASNGTSIVLDDGAKSSDYLEVVAWKAAATSGLFTGITTYAPSPAGRRPYSGGLQLGEDHQSLWFPRRWRQTAGIGARSIYPPEPSPVPGGFLRP